MRLGSNVITTVQCSICGQLNNKPRVVVTDFRLHHTCSIIESVDPISRDEPDAPLTQYITNAGISRARYTITHFKHHHRVLWLISNRMNV